MMLRPTVAPHSTVTFRTLALLVALVLSLAACSSAGDSALDAADPASTDTPSPAADAASTSSPVAEPTTQTLAARATATAAAVPTPVPDAAPARWETGTSEYIFNQNALHTFELTLSPEALAEIDADPGAEQYVEGSLTFEDETVAAVGIRYKGSIGAFVGCLSGPDPFQPSGAKRCTKLSMKVKINWTDPDTTFFGLKKLQFHSQNNDNSQMRERLGYWLFREMGIPAPRSVHARLIVNGEYTGLYALTEQIDGRFARENFDDGTGNMYKEVWPVDMQGEVLSDDQYLDALVTNEDENPSAAIMAAFGTALDQAESTEALQTAITEHADLDQLLAYVAVDRSIRHDDGPLHWYCFGDGYNGRLCSNHNFYFYEDPTEETIHLIPWDLDNAFENITTAANPVTPIADAFGETSGDCAPFSHGGFGLTQMSASCEPLMMGLATYTDEYQAMLNAFLDGPFSEDSTNALLDTWVAQVAAATAEADDAHNDATSVDRWQRSVDQLRRDLTNAREQIELSR